MVKNTLLRAVIFAILMSCCISSAHNECSKLIGETKNISKTQIYQRTDIITLAEKLIACGISSHDARFKDLFELAQQKQALREAYAKLENIDIDELDKECFCFGHGAFCC